MVLSNTVQQMETLSKLRLHVYLGFVMFGRDVMELCSSWVLFLRFAFLVTTNRGFAAGLCWVVNGFVFAKLWTTQHDFQALRQHCPQWIGTITTIMIEYSQCDTARRLSGENI
jgi:hypothetical protein